MPGPIPVSGTIREGAIGTVGDIGVELVRTEEARHRPGRGLEEDDLETHFSVPGMSVKPCYNALWCGFEPGRVARSRFTPRIRCRGCTAGAERSVR